MDWFSFKYFRVGRRRGGVEEKRATLGTSWKSHMMDTKAYTETANPLYPAVGQYKLSVVIRFSKIFSVGQSFFNDAEVGIMPILALDQVRPAFQARWEVLRTAFERQMLLGAAMYRNCVKGDLETVKPNGGPQTLGLRGYLRLLQLSSPVAFVNRTRVGRGASGFQLLGTRLCVVARIDTGAFRGG